MSVTGVMIVIALLLALQIDKVRDPGSPAIPEEVSTDKESVLASSETLEALESELTEVKNHLTQLQASSREGETVEEIRAEIANLENRIERNLQTRNKKRNKISATENTDPEHRKEVAKIVALKAAIERCMKKIKDVVPKNQEISKRLRELEIKVKQIESAILKAREKEQDLVLIPEMNDTTKEPVIVDVSRSGFVVMRIDQRATRNLKTGQQFTAYCRELKKTDHYFVFFMRPSGISLFDDLRKRARQAGFEIGYDAIGEKVKLKMGGKVPK